MLQKTERTETGIKVTYIREKWTEYFIVFLDEYFVIRAGEGELIKRFFLPVYRDDDRMGWVCVVWPLAPFVLIAVAAARAFRQFWRDLVWAVDYWRKW